MPSSPGFVGIFETAAKLALPVYGVDPAQAVTWAIGFHVLSYIPITLIGGWYFLRMGLHLGDLKEAEEAMAHADALSPSGIGAPGGPGTNGSSGGPGTPGATAAS